MAKRFINLFSKLKNWCDDEPAALFDLTLSDEGMMRLCRETSEAAEIAETQLRRNRHLYDSPANELVENLRDFEDRYQKCIEDILIFDILGYDSVINDGSTPKKSWIDQKWQFSDADAVEHAATIENVIDYSYEQTVEDVNDELRDRIGEGVEAWDHLKEVGFDLRGVFRRRKMIPFVLVPRHFANRPGTTSGFALTNLQDAHEAFVFGAFRASLAMMRSIMETTLREHYSHGSNLSILIDNARDSLPDRVNIAALHRLRRRANGVLHLDGQNGEHSLDLKSENQESQEKEIVLLLLVLRTLMERVPEPSPRRRR